VSSQSSDIILELSDSKVLPAMVDQDGWYGIGNQGKLSDLKGKQIES
jgi:hypothetical protein